MATPDLTAAASGTFDIGGELTVNRLGYGAMQIPGKGVWGEPDDAEACRSVLRHAVELGINLIDTADSYGPEVSEREIGEALHPYPDDLVIATKAGLERPGPDQWTPNGSPDHIRLAIEGSLQRLKLETIDLYQLHRIDSKVPAEEQFGVLRELQEAGKVRFLGLSEVSVDDVKAAREHIEVATVQNMYNVGNRDAEPLLDYCEQEGIGFIPWFPLNTGKLAGGDGPLAQAAERHGVSGAQIALAWLLHRSPVITPIPGTKSLAHLEDNIAAAALRLDDDEVQAIADEAAG